MRYTWGYLHCPFLQCFLSNLVVKTKSFGGGGKTLAVKVLNYLCSVVRIVTPSE